MKKKILCLMLALTMSCSLAACGGSGNDSKEADVQESQESAGDDAADAGEGKEEGKEEEVNEYGLTDSQQEALLESVKASVTENFLEKNGIAAEDFKLLPFNAEDRYLNWDKETGAYTGTDPYQCSVAWDVVDDCIMGNDRGIMLMTTKGMVDALDDPSEYTSLREEKCQYKESVKEENASHTSGRIVLDDIPSETYDLANGLYIGIVNFLNELDDEEWGTLLANLYTQKSEAEVIQVPIGETTYMERPTVTMFDRVISENIEF